MDERSTGIAELHQRIPFLLSQLGVYLAEDFVHRLEPLGVEPRTYAVLKALIEDDGQSQRQSQQQTRHIEEAIDAVADLEREAHDAISRHQRWIERRVFPLEIAGFSRHQTVRRVATRIGNHTGRADPVVERIMHVTMNPHIGTRK